MLRWDPSICFLFDNGSLRATSTLSLRTLAAELEMEINVPVRPVSLLHSSGIDPAALYGQPAELLEPTLAKFAAAGGRDAVLLPLFFGPSAALTEYVPQRLTALAATFPQLRAELGGCLVEPEDDAAALIAAAIARQVRKTMETKGWGAARPAVVLVDHGSPQPGVAAVRDRVGEALRRELAPLTDNVVVASMERRAGAAYAFNEPLLERALAELAGSGAQEVVVALQFLQAGRHAGPGGDIATICAAAEQAYPQLRTGMTHPIGSEPEIRTLLWRRWDDALKRVEAR